jgi:alpha-L-arabinofuranosidase
MNSIKIDLARTIGDIDHNIFGGFVEHLGRCIYGGIYEPDSTFADKQGLRTDVLAVLKRLQMSVIRYPGGNFVSGYRWMDGIGPLKDRPSRSELAWHTIESNHFGTNEFIQFCRKLGTEPYFVVNCGDGDMREARDWVEYCNGTGESALVKLRRQHGFVEPHKVKYWGIGNEVDGPWQIGYKTPEEYARAVTEFGKVMKWVDHDIKLIASAMSGCWEKPEMIERTQLILERAGNLVDYLSLHLYVGNQKDDFNEYMMVSERLEDYLTAMEGLICAMRLAAKIKHPIYIAFDEWNVWYRARPNLGSTPQHLNLEEVYNLEDALVVSMFFNAFIRHSGSVKMANIAQIVNVIAPVFTNKDGLFLQTIFFPFELYSQTCGTTALDVLWQGDTFSGGDRSGVRILDVSATMDKKQKTLTLYVTNRSQKEAETTISLTSGDFKGSSREFIINGPDIKAENSFNAPDKVKTSEHSLNAEGQSLLYNFKPHSITALVLGIS